MTINTQQPFNQPPQPFWLAATSIPNFPALDKDIKVDIAIVGGGMTGMTCAYWLSQENIQLAVIEADHILHGTTGHTTAKITSQHGLIYNKLKNKMGGELAAQYAHANEDAIRMIERLIAENHIECDYKPQSAYLYTLEDQYISKIQKEAETAAELGIKAFYQEEIPLPFKVKAAIRFDDQAQFHPIKFLLPLVDKITKAGGLIFEKTRVIEIDENGSYILSTKNGNKITAQKVIIASHYPFYNKPSFYYARIYQERSYVLAIKAKEKYPGGMYINAESPTRSLRSQPSGDNELLFVGGENHKCGQSDDTNKHYKALLDFSHEHFTVEDIPYRWSTQDCMTIDKLPYTGYFTSKTPNLYIATGFKKWGMTNSMASSLLLRDLIIKGKSLYQDAFSPSRETNAAFVGNFIAQNLDVAAEIIEGKLAPLSEELNLACGEAKIVKRDGKRTGIYKDEEGKLHVVNTTCPHMGCELYWNAAEKSWDCPCHGSRFSCDGDVLEGPSVRSLSMEYDPNPISKLINEDF